jgi:hypothetical protein
MMHAIEDTATSILERAPGPVVSYRLLRDVLRLSADAPELQKAKDKLEHSWCIQELAAEQWADGGWGAFHSRNTRLKPG